MAHEISQDEYVGWIKKAEIEAANDPNGYRRKVGLFALLGYGYIFTLLALVVASIAGLAALIYFKDGGGGDLGIAKLGIVLVLFACALIVSLWVTFEAPDGTRVTRQQFPRLFAEIDDLQKRLKTIPVHEIIIVPEFNAFVSQTPRLGIFGWHKNTLGLGLNLMMVLSPQEMRAVIAHELGHLSGNHSRFSGWIYRVRKTWSRLFKKFQEDARWGSFAILPFFHWYAPRFDAYSFALRRQNEYEADAAAAELTSAQIAGQALIKVNVLHQYLKMNFWNPFWDQADRAPQPLQPAFSSLNGYLRGLRLRSSDVADLHVAALNEQTDFDDTHPCLFDRLTALGMQTLHLESDALNHQATAADAWFGRGLPRLLQQHDDAWWGQTQQRWTAHYSKIQEEKTDLQTLRRARPESLEQLQQWRLAALTNKYEGATEALPIFRSYQNRYPEDYDAALVIGRLLRQQDDPSCVAEWVKIPPHHASYVDANFEAAHYLESNGFDNEAARFRHVAEVRRDQELAAEEEQASVTVDDRLERPKIGAANTDYIRMRLKNEKLVKRAWLAQKVTQHPGMPVCIIAFERKQLNLSAVASLDPEEDAMNAVARAFTDSLTKPDPVHIFIVQYTGFFGSRLVRNVRKAGTRVI